MEEEEIPALEEAGAMAWEYLMSIGKTDLALLSREEGLELMHVIVKAYSIAPPF